MVDSSTAPNPQDPPPAPLIPPSSPIPPASLANPTNIGSFTQQNDTAQLWSIIKQLQQKITKLESASVGQIGVASSIPNAPTASPSQNIA